MLEERLELCPIQGLGAACALGSTLSRGVALGGLYVGVVRGVPRAFRGNVESQ